MSPKRETREDKVPLLHRECQVCFTDLKPNLIILLPCGCETCNPCLVEWVLAKLKDCNGYEDYPISCFNLACKKKFKVKDVFFKLKTKDQQKVNDVLLKGYLSKEKDISQCPKCDYAGVIDLKHCKENLNCSVCGTSWRDPQQVSKTEVLGKQIKKAITHKNEAFSSIVKYCFTKKCPQCRVPIQKAYGCNHMSCSRCSHYFCWLCYGNMTSHNICVHAFFEVKRVILWMLTFALVIGILYLAYLLPPVNFICNLTLVPVLGVSKNIILSIFSFFKEIFVWIFSRVFTFIIANCIAFPAVVLLRPRDPLNLRERISFTFVLVVGCLLTYYFDKFSPVLAITLIEVGILIIFWIGMSVRYLLTEEQDKVKRNLKKMLSFFTHCMALVFILMCLCSILLLFHQGDKPSVEKKRSLVDLLSKG